MTLSYVLCRYVVKLGFAVAVGLKRVKVPNSGCAELLKTIDLPAQTRVGRNQRPDLLLPRGLGTMYSLLGSHSSGWKSGFKKCVRLK